MGRKNSESTPMKTVPFVPENCVCKKMRNINTVWVSNIPHRQMCLKPWFLAGGGFGRFKDFKRQNFAGGSGSLGMMKEDGGVVEILWPSSISSTLCFQTAGASDQLAFHSCHYAPPLPHPGVSSPTLWSRMSPFSLKLPLVKSSVITVKKVASINRV